ncbi:hypothetical protein J40TS1_25800 [Paenibacillus montaniterrae]|uniref:Uncharacterized protein n=1 Tax=Paenibacillus montaniterrae TaxID=429341 RepID=A0A919YU71_9BACL|nr:hypothetical protein J40TS1_25800 [Paenibacillus montaniterrae]
MRRTNLSAACKAWQKAMHAADFFVAVPLEALIMISKFWLNKKIKYEQQVAMMSNVE